MGHFSLPTFGSLDGYPLQVKQLRGDDPIESIDLSRKTGTGRLFIQGDEYKQADNDKIASAFVIASLARFNKTVTSLKCASSYLRSYVANSGGHIIRAHGSLDGCWLPVKKLRGEEPVKSIPWSNRFGDASAVVIASLFSTNTVTKTLKYATSDSNH